MNLTQTAEYALRAMARLALLESGEAARAADLSETAAIPSHYVSKLMRRLVVAGLVDSRKGHGGGFTLAKPAATIRFVDVLRAVDYQVQPNRCAFGWGDCDPAHACPLHEVWNRMVSSFHKWAEETTLADVHHDGPLPRMPVTHPDAL